jgi:hypothetical protein
MALNTIWILSSSSSVGFSRLVDGSLKSLSLESSLLSVHSLLLSVSSGVSSLSIPQSSEFPIWARFVGGWGAEEGCGCSEDIVRWTLPKAKWVLERV